MTFDEFRPVSYGETLILDDPDWTVENGVVVRTPELWKKNMDYTVVKSSAKEFGAGDRVILATPNTGRQVRLGGVLYRVVKNEQIIGVVE